MANKEVRLDINGVTYREDAIVSMSTDKRLFDGTPSVGNCVCGELDVSLMLDDSLIPKNAQLIPYIRDPGTAWKKKGEYFIYNRKQDELSDAISIVAYDAIYRSEASYLSAGDQGFWPRVDIDVTMQFLTWRRRSICRTTPRSASTATSTARTCSTDPVPGSWRSTSTIWSPGRPCRTYGCCSPARSPNPDASST